MPLLVTQNYGRGRTAVFATSGSWRWQMQQPLEDMSHEMFWQQMLRWLVSGTYWSGRHEPLRIRFTQTSKPFRSARKFATRTICPSSDAQVEAHIIKPDGSAETVTSAARSCNAGSLHGELGLLFRQALMWWRQWPGEAIRKSDAMP